MKVNSKKDEIIDVGITLFEEKGYSNVGLKEILEEAKVPKGSFYYYFQSKEDFGVQVIHKYSQVGLNKLQETLTDKSKSPVERIFHFYITMKNTYSKCPKKSGCLIGNVSAEMCDNSQVISKAIDFEFNRWEKIMADCLKEAIVENEIDKTLNADSLATFITNSWEGALISMKCRKSIKPLDHFISGLELILK